MARLKWALIGAVGLYLTALLLVYVAQRRFMYFPPTAPAPAGFYDKHEAFRIEPNVADFGSINTIYKPPPTKNAPVILFFHGNGSAAYQYGPVYDLFTSWGAGYLAAEYPSYAGNAGKPNEQDILEISLWYFDTLIHKGIKPEQIILYGDSLGAACAVHVAQKRQAAGLVLTAPFLSMQAMAAQKMPWFPTAILLKDRYRSDLKMPFVKMPLLLINGDADQVIPHAQGKALYDLHTGKKEYVLIKGGQHNLWDTDMPLYLEKAIKQFSQSGAHSQ